MDIQSETLALRRLARALTADDATADDLVQDTWVAALRNPPGEDRPVRPWLSTVMRNRRPTPPGPAELSTSCSRVRRRDVRPRGQRGGELPADQRRQRRWSSCTRAPSMVISAGAFDRVRSSHRA